MVAHFLHLSYVPLVFGGESAFGALPVKGLHMKVLLVIAAILLLGGLVYGQSGHLRRMEKNGGSKREGNRSMSRLCPQKPRPLPESTPKPKPNHGPKRGGPKKPGPGTQQTP